MAFRSSVRIFILLLIAGYAALANPHHLMASDPVVYLEWVDDPLRSVVINWLVDDGSASQIEYRIRGSSSWNIASGQTNSIPHTSTERNSVELNGLSPGNSYEFRVDGSSDIHYFRTAPSSVSTPMRFAIGGDLYRETSSQAEVDEMRQLFRDFSDQLSSQDIYFAVVGGDLAHATNRSTWIDLMLLLLEDWHEHMVTSQGYKIPFVAVIGNNDVDGAYGGDADDAAEFHALFSYPQGQSSNIRGYGVLDFSDYLSLVTLDSGHSTAIPGSQTSWLSNTLSGRSGQSHLFPIYHVAGWPAFRSFRGTHEDPVRNHWHPVFEENNIRMVFEHHDHLYKRTVPIGFCDSPIDRQDDCELSDDGVIYLGGGPWASIVRDLNTGFEPNGDWYHETWESTHNVAVVEISNAYRRVRVIDNNNNEVDFLEDIIHLDAPAALSASDISHDSFTANWEPVAHAQNYRLQVALDSGFSNRISGYSNRNVGSSTSEPVTDLEPNQVYYYRVRAEAPLANSGWSDPVSVELFSIDEDLSTMFASEEEVLADGEEFSTITVITRDEGGQELEGIEVTLEQGGGSSSITTVQGVTDSDGEARFRVRNQIAERVTYRAVATGKTITDEVSIDYTPTPPAVLSASEINATDFTARWQEVGGTQRYLLDVSENEDFTTFLPNFEGRDTGTDRSIKVAGLTPGKSYYYRVRAEAETGISEYSEVMSVMTLEADPDASEISVEPEEVPADGESSSTIQITVRSEDGSRLSGINLSLDQGEVQSEIETVQDVTDGQGVAIFKVRHDHAVRVEYWVQAGEVTLSDPAVVRFTPIPPVALDASEIGEVIFTANWEEVRGADNYLLDVSEDAAFIDVDEQLMQMDAGGKTSLRVSGLQPATSYYYRVRANAETGTSEASNVMEVTTKQIGRDESTVDSKIQKVLANGEQAAEVRVRILDDEQLPLSGVPVELLPDQEGPTVEPAEALTDDKGEAIFHITSRQPGTETFSVRAGGVHLDQNVSIEFIAEEGVVQIGPNFPNPFNRSTLIPIVIPEQMHVRLDLVATTGAVVQTLVNEEMSSGYYEIQFSAAGLASGVYIGVLTTKNGVVQDKMLLVK